MRRKEVEEGRGAANISHMSPGMARRRPRPETPDAAVPSLPAEDPRDFRRAAHFDGRMLFAILVVIVAVFMLVARLGWIQVVRGPELSARAEDQRARIYVEPARRGQITDRDGKPMSYTMQARSLTVSPVVLRRELAEIAERELGEAGGAGGPTPSEDAVAGRVEQVIDEMSAEIPAMVTDASAVSPAGQGRVDPAEIRKKLMSDSDYEVLVRNVDPDVAAEVAERFHGVAADHQDIRQYPNGAVGENIVGRVSMDGEGQFGFEAAGDDVLAGTNGRQTEDVASTGQVIPGTLRDQISPVDGSDVALTVDIELQSYLQQRLEQAKRNSGADHTEAVVLDARTAEVLAMANSDTIDPNGDIDRQIEAGKDFGNPSISNPYEPGSAAKIITAAAALEEGLTTPSEVHQVPGSIQMSGVTVSDAWSHGVVPFTTTGIFGKSSNVGTLMLADRLGGERFAEYLNRFGIGEAAGIELPNESPGIVPEYEDWTGGTFANLPIGQGMSLSTLQLAGVYQALANGGERIPPRIVKETREPSGEVIEAERPEPQRVVSEETARTVLDMFRSIFQSDPSGAQSGTAAGQGIEGYQASGKTGTAQKVDPQTGAYSMDKFWITFAGVAPTDNPRYVIAVMIDEPKRGVEEGGRGGQSAAPIFRDVASWLLDRDNIPPSPPAEPLLLQAG